LGAGTSTRKEKFARKFVSGKKRGGNGQLTNSKEKEERRKYECCSRGIATEETEKIL